MKTEDEIEATVIRMINQLATELDIPKEFITVSVLNHPPFQTPWEGLVTVEPVPTKEDKLRSVGWGLVDREGRYPWGSGAKPISEAGVNHREIFIEPGLFLGKQPHIHHFGCSFGSPDCPEFASPERGVRYFEADRQPWYKRLFRRG